MAEWLNAAWLLLQSWVGQDATRPLFWVFLAVALLVGTVVLAVVSGVLGDTNANAFNNLGVLLVAAAAVVLAASAAPVFLAGHLVRWAHVHAVTVAGGVLALLLVGVPVMAVWHRVRYGSALLAVSLGVAAAALVLVVGHVVFESYAGAERAAALRHAYRDAIERVLERR